MNGFAVIYTYAHDVLRFFYKYAELKTRFVEASQKELLTNPGKFPELLDFRQSLHVQLRTKTEKKDNFR